MQQETVRTEPFLWEKSKKTAMKLYSKDNKWDARVAQQAVRIYKSMGGGYVGQKKKSNSLSVWTEEKWMYHPSDKDKAGRYLPEKVWSKLSPAQVKTTNANKMRGDSKYVDWEPFVGKAFNDVRKK